MKNIIFLFLFGAFSANAQNKTIVVDTLKMVPTKIDFKTKYALDNKIVINRSQELQPFIIETRQQKYFSLKPEFNSSNPHNVSNLGDGLLVGSFDFIIGLFGKK